jgi:acetoin utilization deacetylase AcuC-like enzyme/predicted N-acetyltransferase YhbS
VKTIRIRRVDDENLPVNRAAVRRAQEILRAHFSSVPEDEIERLGEKLRSPFQQRFRSVLFAAETAPGRCAGFALLYHDPVADFCFLDYLSSEKGFAAAAAERALYRRARQEASALSARGLFLECLPDEKALCPDQAAWRKNRAALRFFESFGARPIVNTRYGAPRDPPDIALPYLVADDLGRRAGLELDFVRRAVRAILKRRSAHRFPTERISSTVESFADDPVRLRPYRYGDGPAELRRVDPPASEPAVLVVSDPALPLPGPGTRRGNAADALHVLLSTTGSKRLFRRRAAQSFPEKHLSAVHAPELIAHLRQAGREIKRDQSPVPFVFPGPVSERLPRAYLARSGRYCPDTLTPLWRGVYRAARSATDGSLTAARALTEGEKAAYALVRPPGHHAERERCAGGCYFNNAAVAGHYLSAFGKVAILDLDGRHGNGLQEIFYRRADVLTVSLHAHPRCAYPYFSGFEDERGEGPGEGFNLNLPLGPQTDGKAYRRALERGLRAILDFKPGFLIVALGFEGPAGRRPFPPGEYFARGEMIAEMGVPVLVTQEGGKGGRLLGKNARAFFAGLLSRPDSSLLSRRFERRGEDRLSFRYEVRTEDRSRIREIVEATAVFNPAEIEMAVELADDRLAQGPASGYHFVFADYRESTIGYSCYGPIDGTVGSFDLYWIAVHPDSQGKGWGRDLLKETERRIRALGGTRIYIDTSNRPHYAETRAFYESGGYRLAALLDDFYAKGDAKTIYCKEL